MTGEVLGAIIQPLPAVSAGFGEFRSKMMAEKRKYSGADVFTVDNSDSDWKMLDYFRDWTDLYKLFDFATVCFETELPLENPAMMSWMAR